MCWCIDSVLSGWTPESFTHLLNGTQFPPVAIDRLSMRLMHEREPNTQASIVSLFSLSLFGIIHTLIDSIQDSESVIREWKWPGWETLYSWVSSANFLIIETVVIIKVGQWLSVQCKKNQSLHWTLGNTLSKGNEEEVTSLRTTDCVVKKVWSELFKSCSMNSKREWESV